jgi:hypothetical protein
VAVNSRTARSRFASEAAWPFWLHSTQLDDCAEFFARPPATSRILRIFGASGSGKSFLVRELMVRQSGRVKDALGLYVDVPPSDLEAAGLFDKLDCLLSDRREASRDAPSFVGKRAVRAWQAAQRGRSGKRASYLYLAVRDLVWQIPLVGPFIKALLPQAAPARLLGAGSPAPLRFLMRRSRTRPVVLAIDNVQSFRCSTRNVGRRTSRGWS